MSKACGAVILRAKNRGRICGRAAVAFVAPGLGRCGYHDTAMERTRVRAILQALRDARELRACPREPEQRREDGEEPDHDEATDSQADFDPGGFMDASLDEE